MANFTPKSVMICMWITWACQGQQHDNKWQFSDDFLLLHTEDISWDNDRIEPIYESNWQDSAFLSEKSDSSNQTCATKDEDLFNTSSFLSGSNARQLINCITVGYVLVNIHESYQKLHATHAGYNIFKMIKTPGKYISFFVDCLEITCKALLYKSVAQLIVMCADGDIIDFCNSGLQKAAHLIF